MPDSNDAVFGIKRSEKVLVSLAVALLVLSSLQLIGSYRVAATTACNPDFTLVASKPQTIAAGGQGTLAFTVTSECGLYGTVHYSTSVSPANGWPDGIALHQPTYHPFVLSTTHPAGSEGYQVLTTATTIKTTYTITFTVSVLNVVHSVSVIVTVNGYTITVSPSSLSAPSGQPVQSTITLTSFGGYNSTIYYSVSISPNPPAIGSNSCFNPVPGGPTINSAAPNATSEWTCTITPKGTYNITITAMPLIGAPDLSASIIVKVT